jgi:hypothetical protein
MGKVGNYYKTMSTIPKTNFGQISFRATIASVGFACLGSGKCVSRCNIMDEKG